MEYPPFSVLMSLYINEKGMYFNECMQSILRQTVLPAEIIIVYDGPVSKEIKVMVDEYKRTNPGLIKTIENEYNKGLGLALADGVVACSYELIARMDTDDIARQDRFEKQLKEFMADPALDICGSHILEFEGSISNIVAQRKVPLNHDEIVQYQKKRDGFNHVTVMFKKTSVLNAGNYQSCLLMEDTLLWANMFMNGAKGKNIDDNLVYVRIGRDMYERRGGLSYFRKYTIGRKRIYETSFISKYDYYLTLMIQFIVAVMPNKIRGMVFKKLLHR